MDLHELHVAHIKEMGWTVKSSDPFVVRHTDGSMATGQAAALLMDSLRLPSIKETWENQELGLTCSYVNYVPDGYEHVYDTDSKPLSYYDEVKIGDYWVENGHWYGRREADGFRVLATHRLLECDDSKWEMKESTLSESIDEFEDDDDMPF